MCLKRAHLEGKRACKEAFFMEHESTFYFILYKQIYMEEQEDWSWNQSQGNERMQTYGQI